MLHVTSNPPFVIDNPLAPFHPIPNLSLLIHAHPAHHPTQSYDTRPPYVYSLPPARDVGEDILGGVGVRLVLRDVDRGLGDVDVCCAGLGGIVGVSVINQVGLFRVKRHACMQAGTHASHNGAPSRSPSAGRRCWRPGRHIHRRLCLYVGDEMGV